MHVHLLFCTLVSLFKYDDESIQIFFFLHCSFATRLDQLAIV